MRQLLILLSLAAAPASSPRPWLYDGVVDGLRVEHRAVPGSRFEELRITASSARGLEQVCAAIFDRGPEHDGHLKHREVFRETPTERWSYEQVSAPIVADRDYVMHETLTSPASSGHCAMVFETADDPAHPPVRGYVRIPAIRGRWQVDPGPDGALTVVYRLFSDPGGDLPAFLVRSGQRRAALDAMKRVLARAAK